MCSLVVHFDPLNFEDGEAHCSNVLSDAPRVARGFILGSSLKCKVAKSEVRLLQERIVAAHPDSTEPHVTSLGDVVIPKSPLIYFIGNPFVRTLPV